MIVRDKQLNGGASPFEAARLLGDDRSNLPPATMILHGISGTDGSMG
jgi:hypothetical protein